MGEEEEDEEDEVDEVEVVDEGLLVPEPEGSFETQASLSQLETEWAQAVVGLRQSWHPSQSPDRKMIFVVAG